MRCQPADAFVFFGATGDLAFKKIFPASQAMVKRGRLTVPVIGVGRSAWTAEPWRIFDPVLKADAPVPGVWARHLGALAEHATPPGGWQDPIVAGEEKVESHRMRAA